jgi:hypothetical protein
MDARPLEVERGIGGPAGDLGVERPTQLVEVHVRVKRRRTHHEREPRERDAPRAHRRRTMPEPGVARNTRRGTARIRA